MLHKIMLLSILLHFGDCRRLCDRFDQINAITGHLFGKSNVRFVIMPSKNYCLVPSSRKIIGKVTAKTILTKNANESLVFIGNHSGHKICNLTSQLSKYFNAIIFIEVHVKEMESCPLSISSRLYILDLMLDHVVLKEVYKITPEQKPSVNYVASYSMQDGIVEHSRQNIWERRKDLSGLSFGACSAVWHPYISAILTNKDGSLQPKGILYDVMNVMSELLNMTVTYKKTYKSWWDMVGNISEQKFDLGVAGFDFIEERKELVDFSTPLFPSEFTFYYSKDEIEHDDKVVWKTYFMPFETTLWETIGMFFVVVSMFLLFVSFISLKCSTRLLPFLLGQSSKVTYLALLGKNPGEPVLPLNALQMAIIFPSLAGFTLFSVYRAMLSASLAIKIEHKPYSSFSEIVTSQKRIIIEEQSAIHQHILNSGHEGSHLNNPNLMPVTGDTIGSMTNILNGTFTNSLLVSSNSIEFMDEYPCQIGKLGIVIAKRSTGMVFQKNWPFTELFNWHLHSIFLESGILHKFLEELRGKSKACQSEIIEATRLSQIAVVFVLSSF